MWFQAGPSQAKESHSGFIGVAESSDGIYWEVTQGLKAPLLSAKDGIEWRKGTVGFPSVVSEEGGSYTMWFAGDKKETVWNTSGMPNRTDGRIGIATGTRS